jgi:hypothetical protein
VVKVRVTSFVKTPLPLVPGAFSLLGVVIEYGYFMLKKELGETPGISVLACSRRDSRSPW